MRITGARLVLAITLLVLAVIANARDSVCFGTPSKGRLENGVQLPERGANFQAYSALGVNLGRTYVHSVVHDLVVSSYDALAKREPNFIYVYGETGWSSGGRIRPHRTHQNGASVDFMVPVRNTTGADVPLPTSISNKYGYGLEFDKQGRVNGYSINFDAMAAHLTALREQAEALQVKIKLVIFDPALLPLLFSAKGGESLRSLPFMKGQAWVRHDDHYHIDFDLACKPLLPAAREN